jgi:hypothetical protein
MGPSPYDITDHRMNRGELPELIRRLAFYFNLGASNGLAGDHTVEVELHFAIDDPPDALN